MQGESSKDKAGRHNPPLNGRRGGRGGGGTFAKKCHSSSGKTWLSIYAVAAKTLAFPSWPGRTWECMPFLTQVNRKGGEKRKDEWNERIFFATFAFHWKDFLNYYSPFAWNPFFDGEWFIRVAFELMKGTISVETNSLYEKTIPNGLDGSANSMPSLGTLLNHSCNPNSSSILSNGMHRTVSKREIKKGEQITISYIGVGLDFETREEKLEIYDFICSCDLCESERKRERERKAIANQKPLKRARSVPKSRSLAPPTQTVPLFVSTLI